jgi:hypothetical protein
MSEPAKIMEAEDGVDLGWEELDEPAVAPAEIVPNGIRDSGAITEVSATEETVPEGRTT